MFTKLQMALGALFTWVLIRRGLPSAISLLRLASVWLLLEWFQVGYRLQFLLLAILAASSDWIDGWLARKWDCVSKFGGFCDLVGDKGLALSLMYLGTSIWGNVWWYVLPVLLLVLYHAVVMSLRVIGAIWPRFSWTIMPASLRVAKIKFFLEASGLIAMFATFGLSPLFAFSVFAWGDWLQTLASVVDYLGLVALWVATALAAWSMLGYLGYVDDWPEKYYPRDRTDS